MWITLSDHGLRQKQNHDTQTLTPGFVCFSHGAILKNVLRKWMCKQRGCGLSCCGASRYEDAARRSPHHCLPLIRIGLALRALREH